MALAVFSSAAHGYNATWHFYVTPSGCASSDLSVRNKPTWQLPGRPRGAFRRAAPTVVRAANKSTDIRTDVPPLPVQEDASNRLSNHRAHLTRGCTDKCTDGEEGRKEWEAVSRRSLVAVLAALGIWGQAFLGPLDAGVQTGGYFSGSEGSLSQPSKSEYSAARAAGGSYWFGPRLAEAAGLLSMPPEKLNNSYWLVRAGESEWEHVGLIHTNPVSKTSMDSGLSESGKRQTVTSALTLRQAGVCRAGCWIWPSITQRAYQTAEIIAYANDVTYSRIVPEYSFLDARGLGAYEGKNLSYIQEVYQTDKESTNFRPPKYTDGTPNESVADVLVRVTQLMSILETQYFGDTVIIVSPDSDNLSVLQAALTGLDLRLHSSLAFAPGEVRAVELSSNKPPPRVSGYVSFKDFER